MLRTVAWFHTPLSLFFFFPLQITSSIPGLLGRTTVVPSTENVRVISKIAALSGLPTSTRPSPGEILYGASLNIQDNNSSLVDVTNLTRFVQEVARVGALTLKPIMSDRGVAVINPSSKCYITIFDFQWKLWNYWCNVLQLSVTVFHISIPPFLWWCRTEVVMGLRLEFWRDLLTCAEAGPILHAHALNCLLRQRPLQYRLLPL